MTSQEQITIQGLTNDQIPKWAAFCASCFSYKSNPPPSSYFERHFWNDPRHNADLIRVAINPEGEIVSSVRVFRRTISLGCSSWKDAGIEEETAMDDDVKTVEACGIGEVCTMEPYRRRGISKLLLLDAIAIMRQLDVDYSLLHASAVFAPVYEKVGYFTVNSPWVEVSVDPTVLKSAEENENGLYRVRSTELASSSSCKDVLDMQRIHKRYSEDRFAGCIVRNKEYWETYISAELGNTLIVLTKPPLTTNGSFSDDRVCAWLSIRERAGRYQVREFGVDSDIVSADVAFSCLLKNAIKRANSNAQDDGACSKLCDIHLPKDVWNDIVAKGDASCLEGFDLDSVSSDNDCGWMYKQLKEGTTMSGGAASMLEISQRVPHLIWPTDSF